MTASRRYGGIAIFIIAAIAANYAYALLLFRTFGRADAFLRAAGTFQGPLAVALVFWFPLLVTYLVVQRSKVFAPCPESSRGTLVVIASVLLPFAGLVLYFGPSLSA